MELNDLLPLIGVVVGALLAITSQHLLARMSLKDKTKKMHLENLEHIYRCTHEIKNWVVVERQNTIRILYSGIELTKLQAPPTHELEMRTNFYEPELSKGADIVCKQVDRFRAGAFKYFGKTKDKGGKIADEEYEALVLGPSEKAEESIAHFQRATVALAQKYASGA